MSLSKHQNPLPISLERRIAIVTGASRRVGIGAAVCRALAGLGADICFTYWQPYDNETSKLTDDSGPEALAEELRGLGVRVVALEIDLSQPESADQVIAACQEQLGQPAILVNNAAYSTNDGWDRLDAATLDAHYAVNLRATALLSVAFAHSWSGGEGGRIVNLTSGQDRGPMPGELAYAATKGAIVAFTRTLAAEIGHLGITVNAINPGPTDTGWMTDELQHQLLPAFPLGRLGLPEDAARIIAFLATDAAAWITGQVIHSDGGFKP